MLLGFEIEEVKIIKKKGHPSGAPNPHNFSLIRNHFARKVEKVDEII